MIEIIVTDLVPLRIRGQYYSFISSMWAIGSVAGPILGTGSFLEMKLTSLTSSRRWIRTKCNLALDFLDQPPDSRNSHCPSHQLSQTTLQNLLLPLQTPPRRLGWHRTVYGVTYGLSNSCHLGWCPISVEQLAHSRATTCLFRRTDRLLVVD